MVLPFVAVLFFSNIPVSRPSAAAATLSPLVYNATVNAVIQKRFQCNVEGGFLRWDINRTSSDISGFAERGIVTTAPQQLPNGSYESTLTINATLMNNNTELQCRALVVGGQSAFSEVALFRVQGRLGRPQNLESLSLNSSHNIISWQSPYTLDITDQHPDILYHTVCTTATVIETICNNVSETHFIVLKLNLHVSIYVSSWNIFGQGESATIQIPPCNSSGLTVTDVIEAIVFIDESHPCVHFELSSNRFGSFQVFTVEIYLEHNATTYLLTSNTTVLPELISYSNLTTTVLIASMYSLSQNLKYSAMIWTTIGTTEQRRLCCSLSFSTFDVQDYNISFYDEVVIVICSFVDGTEALGCILQFIGSMTTFERNITRQCDMTLYNGSTCLTATVNISSSDILALPKVHTVHTVKVFDWEKNSGIDYHNPAFVQSVDFFNCINTTPCTINATDAEMVVNGTSTSTTLLVSTVCGSVGLLSLGILVITLACVCWNNFHKGNAKQTEVIYEEPNAALKDQPSMEACPAYRHFSKPKVLSEAVYEEPIHFTSR